MTTRAAISALLLGVLLPWGSARADRGETYVAIGVEPGVSNYKLGETGAGSATRFAGTAFSGAVYRGITNAWHIGGRVHVASSTDVHVANAVVQMQGGSVARGDVYQDHRGLGLGALVLYRLDTHSRLAPVFELEGGVTRHEYSRVTFIPAGATRSYPQSSRTRTGPYGSAALFLEYRLATRWAVSAGVAGVAETGGDMPWGIRVPVQVGFIW